MGCPYDAYDMWEREERRKNQKLSKLPVCCNCTEHIQDEKAYYINGEWICRECADNDFLRDVEDFVG